MSHLDRVRTEIKSWERDFAATHGRDPAVQDIKDNPPIADKYKLYKKLSKSIPNPPFTPVKNPPPRQNPFATPTKPRRPSRAVSPPTASSSHDLPKSTAALSRARKRLRGEPVSPSPSKPKRQRIRSQAPPPFPKLDQDSSNSDYEADQELPHCDSTTSFLTDSPVKAPAGGKSFKLLFDDALPSLSIPTKLASSSAPQFDSPPDPSSSRPPADLLKPRHDFTSKGVISRLEHRVRRTQAKLFPTNDRSLATSRGPTVPPIVPQASQLRSSLKRTLDSGDLAYERRGPSTPLHLQCPLIPPSPPPQDAVNRDPGKPKAKTMASRKKSRVEHEESDQGTDSSDDMPKVTTVGLNLDKRSRQHADDLEWDPLSHFGARNHDPAPKRRIDANHHASSTPNVDLPDKLRRVLAISPSRSQNSMEERVVRGLLYGERVGHYDPSRGGDVWDAGETGDATYGDVETEDDWEGEPVPWDVGEL